MKLARPTLVLALAWLPTLVWAGPADSLLRLVPSDAGATLVVEDLRSHAASFLASPLAKGLFDLPAAKAWRESDAFQQFTRSRREIQAALKTDLPTLRDELFGEAVVLVLQPGPGGDPAQARGLLLTKVRDRALLGRLIELVNSTETRQGILERVQRLERGGSAYFQRHFRAGTKADEWYAALDDGLFAWSNSEALIQGIFDRRGDSSRSLGEEAAFLKVRKGLPARPVASLFVDPRFVERLISAEAHPAGRDDAAAAVLGRYLAALSYAGAALEWRDGIIAHVHQVFAPDRVPPLLRRLAKSPPSGEPPLPGLTDGALAVASANLDLPAVADALISLVPEGERGRIDNALASVSGLLLGRDVRKDVLPALGSRAWLSARDAGPTAPRPAFVATIRVSDDDPQIRLAIANGLRTILSLLALDPARADGKSRVETREAGGLRVTALSGGKTPFAFAFVEGGWLIVGTTAEAVSNAARPRSEKAPSLFAEVRAAEFPDAETFLFVDLPALVSWADSRRPALTAQLSGDPETAGSATNHDLDGALSLFRLFRAAYVTSRISPDATSIHQRLGLLARRPDSR